MRTRKTEMVKDSKRKERNLKRERGKMIDERER